MGGLKKILILTLVNISSIYTKEIMTVIVFECKVLISRYFTILFLIFCLVSVRLRRCIKHSRQCLTKFPNTWKFVKNTSLPVVFSTIFSVFGQTRSSVFDILLQMYIIYTCPLHGITFA